MTEILGLPITRPVKVGIVVADFNDLVTTRLLASAQQALRQAGIPEENILVVQVPGAMELPRVTRRLSETGVIDGVIALGAVVQGETDQLHLCLSAKRCWAGSGFVDRTYSGDVWCTDDG